VKSSVVVFPGSNCDSDCFHVLQDVVKQPVSFVWHKESSLPDCDLVVIPGGFSYGDHLRTGAIARFSPIMKEVIRHAEAGKPVVGICNGFQILLEAGLLPGAMLRNRSLSFICKFVNLRVETSNTIFTKTLKTGQVLRVPIAHGEGNYYCDSKTLKELQDGHRIVFRYCSPQGAALHEVNPNGSVDNVAGILNAKGNVLGMMPHPERASEDLLNSSDGKWIWESLLQCLR
jgi:phosphoribosylformylglycinamidine synthase subunit PurQ / glutaminase